MSAPLLSQILYSNQSRNAWIGVCQSKTLTDIALLQTLARVQSQLELMVFRKHHFLGAGLRSAGIAMNAVIDRDQRHVESENCVLSSSHSSTS